MAREKHTVEGRRVVAGPGVSEVLRVRANGQPVVTWVYKGPGSPNTSTLKFPGNPAVNPSKREQDALCRQANAAAELIRSKARVDKERANAANGRRLLPLTTTVRELCELYMASGPWAARRPATQKDFPRTMRRVIELFGDRAIGDLTGEEVWQVIRASGKAPGTQEVYYVRLRSAFSWAKEARLLDADPMDKRLRARFAAARAEATSEWYRVALTPEEIQAILGQLKPQLRDVVRFTVATALRRRTLRLIEKQWVTFRPSGSIDIHIPAHAMKDKREHRLDVTALRDVIERAMARPGPWLFPGIRGGGTPAAIRKAAVAAGLPVDGFRLRGKVLDLHALRHTAATLAGDQDNARHGDVKELLRHKTDSMVARYMRPVSERQKQVQAALAAIAQPGSDGKKNP